MPCRSSRFKEDRSLQKCKPCLDCGLINRFQKGNCSTTSNAVCGDCLPGSVSAMWEKTGKKNISSESCPPKTFLVVVELVGASRLKSNTRWVHVFPPLFFRHYRKTKLSGFQDMECIPCGDPPPPYEPHCKSLPWPHISMSP